MKFSGVLCYKYWNSLYFQANVSQRKTNYLCDTLSRCFVLNEKRRAGYNRRRLHVVTTLKHLLKGIFLVMEINKTYASSLDTWSNFKNHQNCSLEDCFRCSFLWSACFVVVVLVVFLKTHSWESRLRTEFTSTEHFNFMIKIRWTQAKVEQFKFLKLSKWCLIDGVF